MCRRLSSRTRLPYTSHDRHDACLTWLRADINDGGASNESEPYTPPPHRAVLTPQFAFKARGTVSLPMHQLLMCQLPDCDEAWMKPVAVRVSTQWQLLGHDGLDV